MVAKILVHLFFGGIIFKNKMYAGFFHSIHNLMKPAISFDFVTVHLYSCVSLNTTIQYKVTTQTKKRLILVRNNQAITKSTKKL